MYTEQTSVQYFDEELVGLLFLCFTRILCCAECKQVKQQQLLAAKQHYQHATCSKAWQAWHSRAKQHRKSRTAANRWKRPYMVRQTTYAL